MLLRSSSTPLLGSLISESPSNHHHHHHHQSDLTPNHTPNHCYSTKLSCSLQNFTKISNSPASDLTSNGFRRAQSEGNLMSLAANASVEEADEFTLSRKYKPHKSLLEPIPSFSLHNSREIHSDEEEEDEDLDGDEFGCFSRKSNLGIESLKEEMSQDSKLKLVESGGEMYLARGIGVAEIDCLDNGLGCGIGGGSGGLRPVAFDRDGGDSQGLHIEEHYKKMLEENPGNPLFLRNYANFLYQTKKDLEGAEEYYSRAILADPSDGDILSQYAKLIWELHHDTDRATSYFERAVRASSSDSHIHAAYASFLWEIEDEEDDLEVTPMAHARAATPLIA